MLRSAGQQDYNALQLAFTRRSRGGLTFAANYTLAKGMSDVTQPGGGGAQQAYGVDPNRIHELEWSPSDIDIRHRYAFSLNYQLPFGRDATGATPALVADWQVNLLAYWQSGVPFTVFNATARSNTGAGHGPPEPDLLGRARRPDRRPVVRHVVLRRPGARTPSATPAATTSTGRRSGALDISLFKDVVIGTPSACSCRMEVFNVTNTAELRGARRRPRRGDLWPDHLDRQQHPAAVPVRGEVPVLGAAGYGSSGHSASTWLTDARSTGDSLLGGAWR